MNGRLLPFGWLHFLRGNRTVDRVRVGLPRGQAGAPAHRRRRRPLHQAHFDAAARSRQKSGEAGWILETNEAMNRGLEAMGGTIVKRYRVYERPLAAGA